MGEKQLLHRILRIAVRKVHSDPNGAADVIAWFTDHGDVLGLPEPAVAKGSRKKAKARKRQDAVMTIDRLRAALANEPVMDKDRQTAPLAVVGRLSALLSLKPADADLLAVAVACHRVRPVTALMERMHKHGFDSCGLAAEVAGLDCRDDVAANAVVRLGLVGLQAERSGLVTLHTTNLLDRALARAPQADGDLIACLVGPRVTSDLVLDDFGDRAEPADLIRRLLAGALNGRAKGVNILLHGPPGTGKTELAKVVAGAADATLFAVGEADDQGEEPTRWDRVSALKLAQRLLADRGKTVLLFDEMEDLIGEVERAGGGGYYVRREGSKVFLNRLFETNPVPTIWTSNAIENIDPAYLRRMSFVLKLGLPAPAVRRRVIARIAESEGMALSGGTLDHLVHLAPEAATVARSALKSARLAGGEEDETRAIAAALVAGVRHGRRPVHRPETGGALDLDLYQSSIPIDGLVARLSRPGAPEDFSLLLSGPPGTGKTALARHLARAMDRPLVVRRASDLLSPYVGEAEQQIAAAFSEAAEQGHILLFDEVDSLLFDRASAERSWEVSQVNEMLTWMDDHPMPFVAATNHAVKLDPASARRFDFKIELEALSPAKAASAFRRFFRCDPPADLMDLDGLTPGDFNVVARQIRFEQDVPAPDILVRMLAAEIEGKPDRIGRIGFRRAG
ncbi:MAG: AAA family ATPase [Pseudomonadota bacterium]